MNIVKMEEHLFRIKAMSDAIFLLGKGLASQCPEAENALGFIADTLRQESDDATILLFDEEKASH